MIIDSSETDQARREMRCEGIRNVLSQYGIHLAMEDLLRGYDESDHWLMRTWEGNEEVTSLEQINFIVRNASRNTVKLPHNPEAQEELLEAYASPVLAIPPSLDAEAIETLEAIRGRVQKIGLISNVGRSPGKTLRQVLSKLGILKFFDATTFSDEVGWRKPDKRIFMAAAKSLGAKTEDIIHIGDHPEADIWGAKQMGMHALLLDCWNPRGSQRRPSRLFTLSKQARRVADSEIRPDARISSLGAALQHIGVLSQAG